MDLRSRARVTNGQEQNRCGVRVGRCNAGIRIFGPGSGLHAEDADALNNLGYCYFNTNNRPKACDCWKQAIGLENEDAMIDYKRHCNK